MRVSLFAIILFLFLPSVADAQIFSKMTVPAGSCSALTNSFWGNLGNFNVGGANVNLGLNGQPVSVNIGGVNLGGNGGNTPLGCSDDYTKGLFGAISCKIMNVFNRGSVKLYCNMVNAPEYTQAINAAMAMFVIFWGVSFVIGAVPTTIGSAMVNLLKMVFIYTFATNADFFFENVYNNVLIFPQQMVEIVLEGAGRGSGQDFYDYIDKNFSKLLETIFHPPVQSGTGATISKLDMRLFAMALAVSELVPGGGVLVVLFTLIVAGWLFTYIMVMAYYLLALMSLLFLLMLAPLFIPTYLFKQTKFLGEEWVGMIISYGLQIVLFIIYLVMIEPFMADFLDLVKLGFNNLVLEQEKIQYIVSQGKTLGGQEVYGVFEKMGVSLATAEKYVTKLNYSGSTDEFIPWFVMKLLSMGVIVALSQFFLNEVGTMARVLAGRGKFNQTAPGLGNFGTGFGAGARLGAESKIGPRINPAKVVPKTDKISEMLGDNDPSP